jgi:deoxyribose-phosphate aldolase
MITLSQLTGALQHMMTRPDCTAAVLKEGCALAAAWNLAAVCVRPCDIDDTEKLLKGSGIPVAGAICFPHGSSDTTIKVAEVQKAIDDGAKELMSVMNTGRLLSERFEYVEQDIKAIAMMAFRRSVPVHVVFEPGFLNDRLLKIACKMAENAGAAGIVVSTGYGPAGATPEDIVKIKSFCGDKLKITANGGVKTLDQAIALAEAGADRIATGMTVKILEEAAARRRDGNL